MADISFINGSLNIKDTYDIIYGNDFKINTQLIQHVAGNADNHEAQDIDYTGEVSATNVKDAIDSTDNRIDTHVGGTTEKHDAEDIDYTGNVTASNVKEAIDTTDTRVDNIIASSGTSDTEVVDARTDPVFNETYAVLKDRLDASSQRDIVPDETNGINYVTKLKVVGGKPVMEYEEVL